MKTMMNTRTVSKAFQRNRQEILAYGAFTCIAVFAATCFTQMAFSALLSLSSGIQFLGFCLLILQANNGRDVSNVSLNTLALYVIALCFRLFATLQYAGYQPLDASGQNGLYHTIEILEMLAAAASFVCVKREQSRLCLSDETPRGALVLLTICSVLAPVTHGVLNQNKLGDITWMMGFYVETVAMLPQLYLLQRNGGEVGALHGHYIASTVASRLVAIRFWMEVFVELKPQDAEYNVPGSMVIAAQLLQLIASGDFMYLYLKSARQNRTLIVEL